MHPSHNAAHVRATYARLLAAPDRAERMRALDDLEYWICEGPVEGPTKLALAEVAVRDFHLRGLAERRAVARFLDAWLSCEPAPAFSHHLAALRMEEVDPEVRDSLLPAVYATAPTAALIDLVGAPPPEVARDGYALLVALDALHTRLSAGEHPPDVLDQAIASLRRARAVRGTPVVRPFLWQVEIVLERACERRGVPVPGALAS